MGPCVRCSAPVMSLTELFGYCAAVLTTISFVPQACTPSKHAMCAASRWACTASLPWASPCWLIYGLLLGAWPIVIANVVTLALAGGILVMKLRFGEAWQQRSRVYPTHVFDDQKVTIGCGEIVRSFFLSFGGS